MLRAIQTSRNEKTRSKQKKRSRNQLSFASVEVMVIAPPPDSLMACADGLSMGLLGGTESGSEEWSGACGSCECHKSVEKYLAQQQQINKKKSSRTASGSSSSCFSVDEEQVEGCSPFSDSDNESGRGRSRVSDSSAILTLDDLSTCALPTCLMMHCLGFKLSGQAWPALPPPPRVAPSLVNPAFVASEQAKAARLEEVLAAQSRSHVQVSDVTLDMMDRLKDDWENDSD
jgi:hypothetical protein